MPSLGKDDIDWMNVPSTFVMSPATVASLIKGTVLVTDCLMQKFWILTALCSNPMQDSCGAANNLPCAMIPYRMEVNNLGLVDLCGMDSYAEWPVWDGFLCGMDLNSFGFQVCYIQPLEFGVMSPGIWRLQSQAHEPWNLETTGGVWRLQFVQQCLNTFRGQANGLPVLTLYCNTLLKWMPRKAGWSIDEVNA